MKNPQPGNPFQPHLHHGPRAWIVATSILAGGNLAVSGCNWVDSTGVQAGANSPSVIGSAPPNLDDNVIRTLVLMENTSTEIVPSIDPGDMDSDWTWGAPYETGTLPDCLQTGAFEAQLSVPTLNDACTSTDNCNIVFTFFRSDTDQARFTVDLPPLKAAIGLAYRLSATDSDGNSFSEFLTFCAVSINEAPVAQDDIFDINASMIAVVSSADQINLLSNDFDDIDIRNQPLTVNTVAVVEPQLAENFTLFADGGFSYEPQARLVFPTASPLIDSFVYTTTDGQLDSSATVTLRIKPVSGNINMPPVIFEIDDEFVDVDDTFTIAINAEDADLDPLIFSLGSETPEFVSINPITGEMTGVSDTPGSYTITLIASDGTDQTSASFMLFVEAEQNRPPFADDIRNKAVSGEFTYDVSGFFGDPDGDSLEFSATGVPVDTEISSEGTISGVATAANRGRHIVRVFVTDGRGGSASDGFRLTIQ